MSAKSFRINTSTAENLELDTSVSFSPANATHLKYPAVTMECAETLSKLCSEHELEPLPFHHASRRLMHESEVEIKPSHLAQTIDIDIYLEGDDVQELPNMPDYPVRSVENAINQIRELKKYGINSVVLRLGGSLHGKHSSVYTFEPLRAGSKNGTSLHQSEFTINKRLTDQAVTIQLIRSWFPKGTLHITADPFGIAPNKDGSWGIQDETGRLDYRRTVDLIARIAVEYSEAGVDALLTLGRIEGEVEITKKALTEVSSQVQIKSFSQNIESRSAYVYLDCLDIHHRDEQKILPGNLTEMKLRTLTDIYEGTDTVVVKPSDQLHLITITTLFLRNKYAVIDFLTSPSVKKILDTNKRLHNQVTHILLDIEEFSAKCQRITVGTYTVSGLYYLQKLLEKQRGEAYAFCWIDELFKNVVSIGSDNLDSIIDRNALWYVKKMGCLR